MNILDYIKGKRRGKEAHQIEKASLQDPFLFDALEGYNAKEEEYSDRLERLQKQISSKSHTRSYSLRNWGVAAGILLVLGFGSYFYLLQEDKSYEEGIIAMSESSVSLSAELSEEDTIDEEITAMQDLTEQTSERKVKEEVKEYTIPDLAYIEEMPIMVQQELSEDTSEVMIMAIEEYDEIVSEEHELDMADGAVRSIARKVEIQAAPALGFEAYTQYIKENLHLTDDDCKDVSGTLRLSFKTDQEGKPYDIVVLEALCPSLDKQVIKLMKEGPARSFVETEEIEWSIEF
ncbi:hypothetical protein LJC06_04515 [Bacteroidales bacterium OttesenSCG-928-I14]|nr:hypothetical protein [Bacteroidales bacterium OttesenSCG-928-I14]